VLFGCFVTFGAAGESPPPTPLLFLGNQNIAPVVYLEAGAPAGVAVDIVRALARHIPEPIEIRAMDWAQAQAAVARGDAAALIQINPTEERKKVFDFSDPLLESQFSIFVPSSRTGVLGISSLRGLRVGVEEAGLPRHTLSADPEIHLTVIANFVDGFKQLSDGAVDAVVVDYRVGSYVLSVNRIANIKVAGEPIAFSDSAIAVRKGDAKLLNQINSALQAIRANGVYQSIIDKWRPTEAIFETREQIERRDYQAAIAVLALGLLIAAAWAVTLTRNVAKRRRVEEQLRRVNRARRAVGMCGQALVHATDEAALVQKICEIIVEQAGHRLAWVGYAEQDEAKTVRPVAEAGFNQGYVEMANVTWADTERGHGPMGTCIRTGKTQTVNNIDTDPRKAPWRDEARRRGYASSAAIPLMDAGVPLGALTIYSSEVGAFGDEEVSLLTEFAEDLGYGIASLRAQAERKRAEKEIEHLAYYDPLTELPNRRLFLDRLQQALAGCARSGRKGALLFIGLDNFKILNETAGREVGDQLLIEVSRRIGHCLRNGDTAARLGGDEFVVVLEELNAASSEAAAQAQEIGERLLAALNQPYLIAGRPHHSTPSIGVTLFIDAVDSLDELLKQADIAMSQAKSAGGNALRFFDPAMQGALAARTALESALRLAIRDRQFILYYQPQVAGRGGIVGAEALLRWRHPERGMVPPGEFIPLAEETGLIVPIGQWVLEAACAQLKRWTADPRAGALQLAINVSARQFRQANFVDAVRRALENAGAPAAKLKLELTESLIIDDIEGTIDKMRALKELGVGFSLDDFGTGYSSLSYLTRLPLDQVKIDQSFVRKLPDSANDAAVVVTIITLAKTLGIDVIAEGVETEAQRQFLERHRCPTYQGFLFSKPLDIAEFEQLLK
jgi:diguanylate cyclase (GGDEF)-like protein